MTDLVLELASDAREISEYWDRLANPDAVDGYSALVPEEVLPELQSAIEESLKPASRAEIAKAVAVLIAGCQTYTNAIEDKQAYFLLMRQRLGAAEFPADAINTAVLRAVDTAKYMPATATIMEMARQWVEERRCRLRAIARTQAEHSRRRRAPAEREAAAQSEARREAELEARREAHLRLLQNLETRARQRLGDDGPLAGDVELAEGLSATLVSRAGSPVSWQSALAEGQRWAAKYCRQMALAARVRRVLEQGRACWDDGLAAVKLIPIDETAARQLVDNLEGSAASCSGARPSESFYRALWKIHRACGLDSPVLPEDAAAAAIDNLKHLQGLAELADTRAILNQQVREEWAKLHPNNSADRQGAVPGAERVQARSRQKKKRRGRAIV